MPKRELILLALDASPILKLMEPALKAAGYQVAIVHDSSGLIKALAESTPSLVLIGEKFNGKNGFEEAEVMLDRFPTLPILLYAEKDTSNIAKAVLYSGLSGYIYPPLRTDDIVNAVKASLARARKLGDWLRREVKKTTSSLAEKAKISEAERAKLEAIFANTRDGVIILDENKQVVLINNTACQVFKVDESKAIGRLLLDVIAHPEVIALLSRADDQILKNHEIDFDGGKVFNTQLSPIPNVGFVLSLQDITYIREADRVKSEFINTVSHDLRSPLTAVLGYTELIGRVGELNEQQKDFMRRLEDAVKHITSLVNDLLDLSRMEAGFDTRRESVQLENILQQALTALDGQVKKKKIVVDAKIADIIPSVTANPIRIRQMMDNILENAIKYTPTHGTVEINLRSEDRQVIFNIIDTGPGIPVNEQSRIFEKFYRATNASDDIVGTGLGLAIVKSIVDSHNGRVWVESTIGVGSTFFVVLPAAE